MSIWSTGHWGALVTTNTVKKKDFCNYLIILRKFVEWWFQIDLNIVDLWVDNATVHSAWMTKTFAYLRGIKLNFLPPYSPNLTPVEMIFGVMKRYLITQRNRRIVNFNRPSGRKLIKLSMSKLDIELVHKLWERFIKAGIWVILLAYKNLSERQLLAEDEGIFRIE